MRRCKNCDASFDGDYCPSCGQKDIDLGRPFFQLLGEATVEAVDLDGRAWRTVRTLFAQPGRLTEEFLAGKRKTYTSPIRLYLFISVSFFILMAWIAARGMLLEHGQTLYADAPVQARFMSDQMPKLMFLLLPVFALFLKAVFPRRLYFDHLIYSVHVHSAAFVILAVMLPVEKVASENLAALLLQVMMLVYFVVYIVASIRRVYSTSWTGSIARSVAVLFGYLVVFSLLIETTSSFLIISD
jgi:hypothetical protein